MVRLGNGVDVDDPTRRRDYVDEIISAGVDESCMTYLDSALERRATSSFLVAVRWHDFTELSTKKCRKTR
jgi:hypothetical protein